MMHFHPSANDEGRMSGMELPYGFGATVEAPFEQAVAIVRAALAAEGFGVLTEIDVSATLKQKLDVDFQPYVILGACNPALAYRALSAEPEIGLLLPCNVVVHADGSGGRSIITIMDPQAALALAGNDRVGHVAEVVKVRLQRVLADAVQQAHAQHEPDAEC
jgi:uncharacterized protein (DUF302 family)